MSVAITKLTFVRIGRHRILKNSVRSFVTFERRCVKWSSGVVDEEETIRKKEKAKRIKRINWENYNLFGPLLKSASDRRKKEAVAQSEEEKRDEETVTIRVKEAGYKHLDGPPILRTTVQKRKLSKANRFHSDLTSFLNSAGDTNEDREQAKKTVAVSELFKELITSFPISSNDESSAACLDRLSRHWTKYSKLECFPSVSTVLQQTMSVESVAALQRWERGMILKLGLEGFQKYKQETFDVGSNFHRCIQEHLSGKDLSSVDVEENVRAHWNSLKTVLSHVSDVSLIETKVQHPFLRYTGVLDCVARYRGTTMLIEWKTSQRPKSTLEVTYDNPLQAVAYLGALSFQKDLDVKANRVALVVAYSSGSPAHVHCLDEELCQRYWTLWLKRLYAYYELKNM